jgi:hypothetical protein
MQYLNVTHLMHGNNIVVTSLLLRLELVCIICLAGFRRVPGLVLRNHPLLRHHITI